MSVTVVVPCFDEAARFSPQPFAALAAAVDAVLFVDDGSRDDTGAVLERFAADHSNAEVLSLHANRGKAEAVRAGLLHAIGNGATLVGYYDADLATPVEEYIRLVEVLRTDDELDVVLASRVALMGHAIERRPARHYLGRLYATSASIVLRVPVYDTQCGAKVFRVVPALRSALSSPFADRWAFDVELLARLLHPGSGTEPVPSGRIAEVPLRAWRDVGGSKLGWRASIRAVLALVAVRRGINRRVGGGAAGR